LLINLFEKTPERLLISLHNRQFIICPDNGILTMITNAPPQETVAVMLHKNAGINLMSFTAQMANVVVALAEQNSLKNLGVPVKKIEEKISATPYGWQQLDRWPGNFYRQF